MFMSRGEPEFAHAHTHTHTQTLLFREYYSLYPTVMAETRSLIMGAVSLIKFAHFQGRKTAHVGSGFGRGRVWIYISPIRYTISVLPGWSLSLSLSVCVCVCVHWHREITNRDSNISPIQDVCVYLYMSMYVHLFHPLLPKSTSLTTSPSHFPYRRYSSPPPGLSRRPYTISYNWASYCPVTVVTPIVGAVCLMGPRTCL